LDKIEVFLNNPWISGIGATLVVSFFAFLANKFWEYLHKAKALKLANTEIINILLVALVNLKSIDLIYIKSIMNSIYRKNNIPEIKQNSSIEVVNDLITSITKLQYISNIDKESIIGKLLELKMIDPLDPLKPTSDVSSNLQSVDKLLDSGFLNKSSLNKFVQIYILVVAV